MRLGLIFRKFVVHREYACRRSILGSESVASSDDCIDLSSLGGKSSDNIHVERLTKRSGFLCTVKNSDLLDSCGNSFNELLGRERTIETYLYKTDLLTLCSEVIDDFFRDVVDRTHGDDDAFCVRSAIVVEQTVISAEFGIDLVHVLFYDCRNCIIESIVGLTMLEEDIIVLVRAAHNGMLGVECALTECGDRIHITHFLEVLIVPYFDVLKFMRRAESVKEVEEGNTALDSSKMRYRRQVHDFLGVCLCEHRKTGLTAGHHV